MWLVMALWLHTRAILRSPYWAFGAGIALSLAFLTKQLAFGLAVLPMLGVELSVLRRDGLRRVAFRSVMWGVPPLVCAATWAGLGYAREGKRFVDMLWDFALAQRFQGYSGTVHFNSLNRVAGVLEEVCQPFSWPVATLGLWLFGCHAYRRGGRRARAALAVVLLLLACVAVIENTSKSVLPWYSFSLMPAFGLGWAWLVTQGYRVARVYWRRPRRPLQLVWGAHAGLGAYVLYSALIASARGIVSQVNVALLLLAVASLASAARFARAPWARRVPGATLGLGLALLTVAHFRHTEYRVSPRATDAMMGILGAAGAERPVVSRSVNASDPAHYEPITLFGTHVSFGPEPWRGHAKSSADAFADLVVVPEEALPPPGIRLHRVAGGSVWTGDMSLDPLPQASLEGLLAQGPLTFEAEHMDSSRDTSLVSDRRASGGRARRYKAWLSEGNKDHVLSRATTTPLPPGKYVAVVYLRWRCGPQSGSRVGQIRAGGAKRELGCKGPDRLANYQPIALSFGVERAEGVSSSVTFRRGRGELWHDKTELWRVDVWQARASATP
jgi:hypothetical protein